MMYFTGVRYGWRSGLLCSVMLMVIVVGGQTRVEANVAAPTGMLTEWHDERAQVTDPCPDLYWQFEDQSACQVRVWGQDGRVWDSGKRSTPVTLIEYEGPDLQEGPQYHWRVRVWKKEAEPSDWTSAVGFTYKDTPRPMVNPHIRTFMNFGGSTEFAVANLDLTFHREPNQIRPEILALQYSLLATMVIPSDKAKLLEKFCVDKGLTEDGILEEMFCHFRTDTKVTLHVGAERAANQRETRNCPGWDPRNDRNGDGRLGAREAEKLVNPQATARRLKQARIPIYYWGPPRDDFVMNISHPMYQKFLAELYCPGRMNGYDGLYIDTTPTDVAGVGRHADVVEFPRPPDDPHQWLHSMQTLMAKIKVNSPDSVITANGWGRTPLVIDGLQSEGWMRVSRALSEYERRLQQAVAMDGRGKIQMLQYNPIFHNKYAEFGEKVPISLQRDAIFGLATYYLVHGNNTYYAYGRHPYRNVQQLWPEAAAVDIGKPESGYHVFVEHLFDKSENRDNLLPNGDFEVDDDSDGNPDKWRIAEPVQLDDGIVQSGQYSARIDSDSPQINNFSKGWVTLKPNTGYTLSCWMKTRNVIGDPGAQVYPYEFDGAEGGGMITVSGTSDWKKYAVHFQTGDDTEGRINFRMYGATGTAWFDDIQLVEGASGGWKVFSRNFTRALVLAKPYCGGDWGDRTATTHDLGGRYRQVSADGNIGDPITEIDLRSGEGAILMKVGEQ